MKATELRIGNYVTGGRIIHLHQNGFIEYEVEEGHSLGSAGKLVGVEPIPLTTEWLEKFGFKFNDKGAKYLDAVVYEYHIELSGGARRYVNEVHDLQNIYFALTGRELELKP